MYKTLFLLLASFFTSIASSNDWLSGGLYSVPYEDGSYVIIKIIETDSVGVHLSLYSNVFDQKPENINESDLLILSDNNQMNLPAGAIHVAVSHGSFENWGASFIQYSMVTEIEREAFENWYKQKGGFY